MGWENLFEGRQALCALPEAGDLREINDAPAQNENMARVKEAYNYLAELPNSPSASGQIDTLICTANSKSTKNIAGEYQRDAKTIVLYDPAKFDVSETAIALYHEYAHDRYAYQPLAVASLKPGGDQLFDYMLDEAQAFFRSEEAAQVLAVQRDGLLDLNYSPLQPFNIRLTVANMSLLYSPGRVEEYIAKNHAFPPLMAHAVFMEAIQKLQTYEGYRGRFEALDAQGGMHLSPAQGDVYAEARLNNMRDNIGAMPGLTSYLLDRTVLGARTRGVSVADDVKGNDFLSLDYFLFIGWLNNRITMSDNPFDEDLFAAALSRFKVPESMQYPFIVKDLGEAVKEIRMRLSEGETDFPRREYQRRLHLLDSLVTALDARPAGDPGNQETWNALLRRSRFHSPSP